MNAPSCRQVAVVLNPIHTGSGPALEAVRNRCRHLEMPDPIVHETTPDSPGGRQAAEAVDAGADVVVAIGGDGTVVEVAGALAGTGVPMGIVPTGTANLYARSAGLHGHPVRRLARWAIAGAPEAADLGRVDLTTTGGTQQRPFLVVVGIGHDADTIADVSVTRKADTGWMSYITPGLRRLTSPLIPMRVRLDDTEPRDETAWSVLISNTGRLPWGLTLVDQARPNDGVLHLSVVHPDSPWQWAHVASYGVRPRYRVPNGLSQRRGTQVTIEVDQPRRVQVDGDLVEGVTALSARIEPGAVLVHTRPSRQSTPKVDDLSNAAIARFVHASHRRGISSDGGAAIVRLLTELEGDRFLDVKYLLNSQGDLHDLEKLVYDDLSEAPRERLLAHIAAQARAVGTVPDLRVLCDIDDTLKAAIHDDRYDRGTIYPGIEAFLRALDEGAGTDPGRPGDLTFVTARPGGPQEVLERYTRDSLAELDLPRHSIMGGALLNLHTKTAIADRKIQNIARDRHLFPECRMVFCGDSGQADAQVGLHARRDYGDHVAAVFIHDVVGVDDRTRDDWAREGVYAVDTWDEAARIAHDLQLISEEGLREVESAVEDARQRGEGPRPRS